MSDVYAITDEFSILFINSGHAAVISAHGGEVRLGEGHKEVRVGAKADKALDVLRTQGATLSAPSAIDAGLLQAALKHISGQVTFYTFTAAGGELGLVLANSTRTVMIMPIKRGTLPVSRPVWIEAEDARYHVEVSDDEPDQDEE